MNKPLPDNDTIDVGCNFSNYCVNYIMGKQLNIIIQNLNKPEKSKLSDKALPDAVGAQEALWNTTKFVRLAGNCGYYNYGKDWAGQCRSGKE